MTPEELDGVERAGVLGVVSTTWAVRAPDTQNPPTKKTTCRTEAAEGIEGRFIRGHRQEEGREALFKSSLGMDPERSYLTRGPALAKTSSPSQTAQDYSIDGGWNSEVTSSGSNARTLR